jgi:hypothetical protein
MKTKCVKYEIEWANGEKEIVKVPSFISPAEVKRNLPHSEVQMFIPDGYHAYVLSNSSEPRIDGPAWITVEEQNAVRSQFKSI